MPPAKRAPAAAAKPRKPATRKRPARKAKAPESEHARLTKPQLLELVAQVEAELQKLRGLPGSVVAATKSDLSTYPPNLREGSLAANALALARELDKENSATSKSMCARAHLEVMDRLRELAPPEETHDHLDEVGARRDQRRAGTAAAAGEAATSA